MGGGEKTQSLFSLWGAAVTNTPPPKKKGKWIWNWVMGKGRKGFEVHVRKA